MSNSPFNNQANILREGLDLDRDLDRKSSWGITEGLEV